MALDKSPKDTIRDFRSEKVPSPIFRNREDLTTQFTLVSKQMVNSYFALLDVVYDNNFQVVTCIINTLQVYYSSRHIVAKFQVVHFAKSGRIMCNISNDSFTGQ